MSTELDEQLKALKLAGSRATVAKLAAEAQFLNLQRKPYRIVITSGAPLALIATVKLYL